MRLVEAVVLALVLTSCSGGASRGAGFIRSSSLVRDNLVLARTTR